VHVVLTHKVLVIERVEVTTFTLVWYGGGVADHVSVRVINSVVEVIINRELVIDGVYENFVGGVRRSHLFESLDVGTITIESRGEDE